MWQSHFKGILNSCTDFTSKQTVLSGFSELENLGFNRFTPADISEVIKLLKLGKASGLDLLASEHFKYCHEKIYVLLCLLFNSMLIHGYLPCKLMDTIISPVIKDKKGNITDKENYRPIAITCVSSKILELLILKRCEEFLSTTDNQFGFKKEHSTDMCVFVLKQILEYYSHFSSPVYICFLDASKAFDKINHWHLFYKLTKRNMPCIFVRLLSVWYASQVFVVRWGNTISLPFTVTNGVRQGGILSPVLFNVYMDELSLLLNRQPYGCILNNVSFNHMFYADDSVLLAPSPSALQKLLNICDGFATMYDIKYNVKKSFVMCIRSKQWKQLYIPECYLDGNALKQTSTHKYLGVFLSEHLNDTFDVLRQRKSIFARGNVLISRFKHCSDDVKAQLFKSYCSTLYCSQLWNNHTKASLTKLSSAYNKVFRILMKAEPRCSISNLFVTNNVDSLYCILRKAICSFINRIHESRNVLVSTIVNSFFYCNDSFVVKKWHAMLAA